MNLSYVRTNWFNAISVTVIFCTVIAVTTYSVWPSSFARHLGISFGFGVSAIFISGAFYVLRPHTPFRIINITTLLGSLVIGTANAYILLRDAPHHGSWDIMLPVLTLGVLFTTSCYIYFASHEKQLLSDREIERGKREHIEYERTLLLSQLQQLQSQIEPHFLFNSLATISVLIDADSDKAKKMIEQLTTLFRVTLKKSRTLLVSIDEEIELINSYLSIQQIRLGNRLSFDVKVDMENRQILVPPMLIQPLIENAVMHGVEPKAKGGGVTVSIEIIGDQLVVTVSDDGVGLMHTSHKQRNGLGLSNVRDRLLRLYSGEAALTVKENSHRGVDAQIRLPLNSEKLLSTRFSPNKEVI